MGKVALYWRVSTDTQESDNQLLELRQWAEGQGHTVVSEYVDVASGARRRERLDDLFDDARRCRFDLVAIWSLDRLTREGPLATLLYLQRLTTMGIRVLFPPGALPRPRLTVLRVHSGLSSRHSQVGAGQAVRVHQAGIAAGKSPG